jgi:hypothetical protein
MPTSCTIDPSKRLVSVRFAKKLTVHDIEGSAAKLQSDPRFNSDFSEIADLRELEEVELKAGQALHLADRIDPFAPTSKRVFAAQSPAQINAARTHLLMRKGNKNMRIIETMEAALQWIES